MPKCVVEPRSAKDISSAVFVLSLLSTRTDFSDVCKFAIRSGGHTPWAGSANIEGGVTIDMKYINQVDVSSDQTVTSVGPGNRWVDVYLKLDAMGLAIPGGRVSEVGVGGLTLGGESNLSIEGRCLSEKYFIRAFSTTRQTLVVSIQSQTLTFSVKRSSFRFFLAFRRKNQKTLSQGFIIQARDFRRRSIQSIYNQPKICAS